MAESLPQPVVLDATVLSNFASSGAIDWLVDCLASPAVVPAVRDELERGRDYGHSFLDAAIDPIGDELIVLAPDDDSGSVPLDRSTIRDALDPGEAASLLAALTRDGTLATDDLAARRIAAEYGVRVTGSIGLLVVGIRRNVLDVATANGWIETWRTERGYYAPVDSVEEVLEGDET